MWKRDRKFKDIKKKVPILLWSCPQEFIYVGALQWHKLKWRVTFNWSLPASWQFGRYSISSTLLLYIIYTALAGGVALWEASAWKYLDCYIRSVPCHACQPVPSAADVFTPPQFLWLDPKPAVLCPLFITPRQSCSHVRRSWGWPRVLFPAFGTSMMVICRAQLCLRSFLGSSGNLTVFNLFECMFRQWPGVERGTVGCE